MITDYELFYAIGQFSEDFSNQVFSYDFDTNKF